MISLYHLFTFLENIRGATTALNPTANQVAMIMKNQSISSFEACGADDANLLEFVWQLFIKGGSHNPWLPSKAVGINDYI